MLDNIKLMLGYTDNEKDSLIMLYISKVTTEVMKYCNLIEFDTDLESFVENKIVNILDPNSKIKSVNRGDTTITYNTDSDYSISLSEADRNYLRPYRRCNLW